MNNLKIVEPLTILPSQNFLKPDTATFIFKCIQDGQLDKLPPAPIVRKNESGQLVAIDGHNLIAVYYYLDRDIEVHLAGSASDGIEVHSQADEVRNAELKEKFDRCLLEAEQVSSSGIKNFADLIAKYPSIFHLVGN